MKHATEREWEAHGLQCAVLLVDPEYDPPARDGGYPVFGLSPWLCGYVAVAKAHPLYGVDYGEHSEALAARWEEVQEGNVGDRGVIPLMLAAIDPAKATPDRVLDVHGSITFAGDGGGAYPVPAEGVWWFGFDCNHSGDYALSLDYVVEQCERLAAQLAALAEG